MKIIFDFDGVICDSAFEAFRIALTTVGCIKNPYEPYFDHLYQDFLEKRIFVGPAWNYYFVMNELINNQWEPWTNNNDSQKFTKAFFQIRKRAQKHKTDWIGLNPLYKGIREILSPHNINILTNKNREPVEDLLHHYNINYDTIISMPEQIAHKNKCDLINDYFQNERIKFIDDHIGIVTDIIARKKGWVDARHASWGYTKDNIEGITLDMMDLKGWLADVQ